MSRELANHHMLAAQRVVGNLSKPQVGIVTGYDPAHYCAKVTLQPSGQKTGWLPIASHCVGNGWGIYSPPSLGDAVTVYGQEGDDESRWIEGRHFGGANQPLPVQSGELWLVQACGTAIKLTNDANLLVEVIGNLIGNVEGSVNLSATGNVNLETPQLTLKGNLAVTGNVTATGTITDLVPPSPHTL